LKEEEGPADGGCFAAAGRDHTPAARGRACHSTPDLYTQEKDSHA
jgi:hypothetical protein